MAVSLYNSQELATAVQYGINVVAIVFNDNAYGNVLRAQIVEYDGHVVGTRLHNPDLWRWRSPTMRVVSWLGTPTNSRGHCEMRSPRTL